MFVTKITPIRANERRKPIAIGQPRKENVNLLKNEKECPHIVVGTPGRLLDLAEPFRGRNEPAALDLSGIKHFIVDECDQVGNLLV